MKTTAFLLRFIIAIHNEGGNPMPIYSSIFGLMVMGIDGHRP